MEHTKRQEQGYVIYTIDQLNFKTCISESEFPPSSLVFLRLYVAEIKISLF